MTDTDKGELPSDRPIVLGRSGDDDIVRPFAIEGMDVRGRLVRLGPSVEAIVSGHASPPPLAGLVAEAAALAALLGSMIKFDGVLTIEARGKKGAALRFLVADYHTPGHVRAYVEPDPDRIADIAGEARLDALFGDAGYLVMTIDQGADMERYQGIVALEGASLADCALAWFKSSEQTPTALCLASGRDPLSGHWRAGGIMVQHLARGEDGGPRLLDRNEAEHWRRARILMESVKREELLDPALPADHLLYRLFHEDGVRVHEPTAIAHRCRCKRARLLSVLKGFGADDLRHMMREGAIEARCQFCGRLYRFTAEDVGLSPEGE